MSRDSVANQFVFLKEFKQVALRMPAETEVSAPVEVNFEAARSATELVEETHFVEPQIEGLLIIAVVEFFWSLLG